MEYHADYKLDVNSGGLCNHKNKSFTIVLVPMNGFCNMYA